MGTLIPESNRGILDFNAWLNDAIYSEEVGIDLLMLDICKKLESTGLAKKTELCAQDNGSIACLYETSPSQGRSNARTEVFDLISSTKLLPTNPYVTPVADNLQLVACQLVYQDTPLYVLVATIQNKTAHIEVLNSVANKINLAFRYKEERRFNKIQKSMIEEFFERGLQTQEAWNVIAKYSTEFLPNFKPFITNSPKPLAQVLTYKNGDLHLVMRATKSWRPTPIESCERLTVPIKVDESVCGILIEKQIETLLINPARDYPDRYQAYLFHNQLAQSELVIAVKHNDEVIAIINIEHPAENVFSSYCVEAMRRAAKALAPLINAVIEREEKQRRKEISLLYVMTEVLSRMASVYRHKIGQTLLKSRTVIEDLVEDYAQDSVLQRELPLLRMFIDDFDRKSKAFLTELPSYIKYQRIGVCFATSEAIKELDAVALENNRSIKIQPHYPDKEIDVYASPMLKEHIYNLVNNSVLAIQQRMAEKKQDAGLIEIRITHQEVTDTLNKKTSPARVYIEILDNGGGVDDEHYPHIHEFGYTTRRERGGTGYGLPSAREYIQSVHGGDFRTINQPSIGFIVRFFLQEFDPSYHLTIKE